MFIAALLVIAKTRKQPRCPSGWMDEGNVLYHTHARTVARYSVMTVKESLLWAAKWVSLEVCMPSDMSDKEWQAPPELTYMWNRTEASHAQRASWCCPEGPGQWGREGRVGERGQRAQASSFSVRPGGCSVPPETAVSNAALYI